MEEKWKEMEGNGIKMEKMEGNGRKMEGNGREMEGNGNSKTKMEEKWKEMEEKWKEMEMFASPPPCPPKRVKIICFENEAKCRTRYQNFL